MAISLRCSLELVIVPGAMRFFLSENISLLTRPSPLVFFPSFFSFLFFSPLLTEHGEICEVDTEALTTWSMRLMYYHVLYVDISLNYLYQIHIRASQSSSPF